MDLITTAIIALILYFILNAILKAYVNARQARRDAVVKYLTDIIHQVNIETHYNTEYWFDEHNGQFLGQGATFNDVIDVLKTRFPNHIFLFKDVGGLCARTDWQILPFEEFKKIDFLSDERK